MKDWRSKIRNPNCELCPLNEEAEHVCLMGDGPLDSKIMIVGEAPGEREDDEHRAFVGRAGQLLDKTLAEVGLPRSQVYITNAAKCRPPENRQPSKSELSICSSTYLVEEIEKLRPSHILLLGNAALQAVVGRSGITKYRAKNFGGDGIFVFATYHPAAVLRNPKYAPEFQADLRRFAQETRGESTGLKTRTKLIRTIGQLKALRSLLMRAEVIVYDIETTGLWEWEDDARIVSVGFSVTSGQAYVVPIHHNQSPWKDPDAVLRFLKPAFERKDAKYVAHNGKFDCRWLASGGIFVQQTFDTMLAAHMLNENRSKGLEPLAQVELSASSWKQGGELTHDAFNAPLKQLAIYNGLDCDYEYRLYKVFRAQLLEVPRIQRVFSKLMMPASNALTQVEAVGIWVDPMKFRAAHHKANKMRQLFAERMLETTENKELNFNSPQQIAVWLFDELGFEPLEHTAGGAYSTNESVLMRLARVHKEATWLLEWRKWNKFITTYLNSWEDKLDHRGRLHTTYKLYGTVTGRLSSEGPNLQQVPRDTFIRSILGAPPGWKLVEADYSQIELRVVAMLAREKRMLAAFLRGDDLHLKTSVEITGKKPDEITKEERKKAKAVNFGFLYDMGGVKFEMYARDNFGITVPEGEGDVVRERYFNLYPGLHPWHERQRRLVRRYSQVHSPIGRVRHLPDVQSGDKAVRAEAERQAINSPVQSFASDLMLLSLVQLNSILNPYEARIVATIHDALLFEVRDEAVPRVCKVIKETMEDMTPVRKKFGTEVIVPIEVEIKVGQHWGEGEVWEM